MATHATSSPVIPAKARIHESDAVVLPRDRTADMDSGFRRNDVAGEATTTYDLARARLETYFDRTARDAWERLTSDAPVGRIRATVREGRTRMRDTLLGWLPDDLRGARILDAGCGTGALAVEAARRGADVVAIDVAGGLIDIARERATRDLGRGTIDWRVGDMLDPALGSFDFAVAMDSLIHYRAADMVSAVATLAERVHGAIAFTFAPRTPALSVMHAVGKLFPRGNRSPAIIPVTETHLQRRLGDALWAHGWGAGRTRRISGGFYTSHALELVRP